ncbi:MAG TPA: DUF3048 domain-containing protein [Nakamurella sp.]
MGRSSRIIALVSALLAGTLLLVGCSTGSPAPPSSSSPTSSARPTPSPSPTPTPTPTPEPPAPPPPVDALTGGPLNEGPVIAAKIDNTSAGLPQYGVADADITYIEQVEGGLTRLMPVFHTTLPTDVGPVRSVRTTDAELLPAFGVPALVFSGGGGIPLAAIANTPVIQVAEEEGAGGFRRGRGTAPFNLHADLQQVLANTTGLSPARSIGFVFAAGDPRVDAAPPAAAVTVRFQAAEMGFGWTGSNYQVYRQSTPLEDAGGASIVADNVLIQNVDFQPDGEFDSAGSPSFISHTVGTGAFTLYRDGRVLTGTWSRPAQDQPFQFLDGGGQPVPFKPGKTWVALVPGSASVEQS